MSRTDKPWVGLAKRKREAHKGDFGRVLVVGGSRDMPGAPSLAALAALRGGAGLVKVACPVAIQQTVISICPCATSAGLPTSPAGLIPRSAVTRLRDLAEAHDVVAVGPGMGTSAGGGAIVAALLALAEKPVVVDADGLNNLARRKKWWEACKARVVLTPHPGEMRRLIQGAGLDLDVGKRVECCREFARVVGQVVLLKGAGTVISDGRRHKINRTGNPGMATGGSGDVLTGLIAALMGQGLEPYDAAVAGAYLHGRAGDLAARSVGQVSLMPTDLIAFLAAALRS
jgi:ADP-dependent NAD(P)H-hydrate dehydratase